MSTLTSKEIKYSVHLLGIIAQIDYLILRWKQQLFFLWHSLPFTHPLFPTNSKSLFSTLWKLEDKKTPWPGHASDAIKPTSQSEVELSKKMCKPSEPSSQSTKITPFLPSDTPLTSRTSGKISFGPSKFKRKTLQLAARSKNNTTTCGTQFETKLKLTWLPTLIPRDWSLLVFHWEVDSLC